MNKISEIVNKYINLIKYWLKCGFYTRDEIFENVEDLQKELIKEIEKQNKQSKKI